MPREPFVGAVIVAAPGRSLPAVRIRRFTYDVGGNLIENAPDDVDPARNGARYTLESLYNGQGERKDLRFVLNGALQGGIHYGYRSSTARPDTLIDRSGARTYPRYGSTHQPSNLVFRDTGLDQAFGRGYRHDALGRTTLSRRVYTEVDTTRSYTYDAGGRLTGYQDVQETGVTCTGDPDAGEKCSLTGEKRLGSAAHSYDALGNRTDGGATYRAGTNQLVAVEGYPLEYDADGNLTRKTQRNSAGSIVFDQQLFWISLSQLDSVCTNAHVVGFGYDGQGRRVRKRLAPPRSASCGTATTYTPTSTRRARLSLSTPSTPGSTRRTRYGGAARCTTTRRSCRGT